jgi:hypothetical protein
MEAKRRSAAFFAVSSASSGEPRPIPTIIAYGLDEDKASGLGPFIMEFIEGTRLDQLLTDDNENFQPGLDRTTWEYIRRQIATIYLEL